MKRNIKYLWLLFTINILLVVMLAFTNEQRLFILILVLSDLMFMFYFVYKNHRIYLKSQAQVNQVLEKILGEKNGAQLFLSEEGHKILQANLNRLAKKVEKITDKKEEDELTIRLLMNNITSPILYVDLDSKVRYLNEPFIEKLAGRLRINELYDNIADKTLYRFIDDAFIKEVNQVETLLINDQYYHALAIPVKNNHKFVGILFIFHDITEIKKYEKLQRHFLADASHELKTPLAAIKGCAELLLDRSHSEEAQRELMNIIKVENERMEKIINDILFISRLESDNITLKLESLDLRDVLLEVIHDSQIHLNQKQQKLNYNIEEKLSIIGDHERLVRVFQNLVMNAIHYTEAYKTITINAYRKDDKVLVAVIDEGIGIAAADIPHIFERFYRVDRARSRETGGTGLGLSIVKSILDIHQATIEVKSEVGKGSQFIIEFKFNPL